MEVGVPTYVVSNLEAGKVPHASEEKLRPLARKIGVSVESLRPPPAFRSLSGRWSKPVSGEFDLSKEDVESILQDYDRPVFRDECLTSVARYEIRAARASKFGLPILGPDPLFDGDGRPDGANCARPCPFVGCKHHLYLDVNNTNGGMKIAFPALSPEEMSSLSVQDILTLYERENDAERESLVEMYGQGILQPSCALDVADSGESLPLEQIGLFLGVTRERVRQIEVAALAKAKKKCRSVLSDYLDEEDAEAEDASEEFGSRMLGTSSLSDRLLESSFVGGTSDVARFSLH